MAAGLLDATFNFLINLIKIEVLCLIIGSINPATALDTKTKELDPVGGHAPTAPPGSANVNEGHSYICVPNKKFTGISRQPDLVLQEWNGMIFFTEKLAHGLLMW